MGRKYLIISRQQGCIKLDAEPPIGKILINFTFNVCYLIGEPAKSETEQAVCP